MSDQKLASAKYFIIRNNAEEGPYTVAQINRMISHRQLTPADECRKDGEQQGKVISEALPHLAFQQPTDPTKRIVNYRDPKTKLGPASIICGLACWFVPFFWGLMLMMLAVGLGFYAVREGNRYGFLGMVFGGIAMISWFSHIFGLR